MTQFHVCCQLRSTDDGRCFIALSVKIVESSDVGSTLNFSKSKTEFQKKSFPVFDGTQVSL